MGRVKVDKGGVAPAHAANVHFHASNCTYLCAFNYVHTDGIISQYLWLLLMMLADQGCGLVMPCNETMHQVGSLVICETAIPGKMSLCPPGAVPLFGAGRRTKGRRHTRECSWCPSFTVHAVHLICWLHLTLLAPPTLLADLTTTG